MLSHVWVTRSGTDYLHWTVCPGHAVGQCNTVLINSILDGHSVAPAAYSTGLARRSADLRGGPADMTLLTWADRRHSARSERPAPSNLPGPDYINLTVVSLMVRGLTASPSSDVVGLHCRTYSHCT